MFRHKLNDLIKGVIMRKFLSAIAVAAVFASSAHADPDISWGVTISSGMPPPPAVRYEPPPPPRPAYVWLQGYWGWSGVAYVWVPGRWEAARPGYVYVQPRWQQVPRGWQLQQGGWRVAESGGPGRDFDRGRGGPGHCPPGHRKKGEC